MRTFVYMIDKVVGVGKTLFHHALTAPNGTQLSSIMPDIQFVYKGRVYVIELQSPSQTMNYFLREKAQKYLNAGIGRNQYFVIEYGKKYPAILS